MKKIYDAPVLELLAFCSASAIGSDFEEGDTNADHKNPPFCVSAM